MVGVQLVHTAYVSLAALEILGLFDWKVFSENPTAGDGEVEFTL